MEKKVERSWFHSDESQSLVGQKLASRTRRTVLPDRSLAAHQVEE